MRRALKIITASTFLLALITPFRNHVADAAQSKVDSARDIQPVSGKPAVPAPQSAIPQHWGFVTPRRSTPPEVKNRDWIKTPIDQFVLARLEQEGLRPSPEADRVTLLRRLSLDLIGLPPTVAEVDAFLDDKSPDAY